MYPLDPQKAPKVPKPQLNVHFVEEKLKPAKSRDPHSKCYIEYFGVYIRVPQFEETTMSYYHIISQKAKKLRRARPSHWVLGLRIGGLVLGVWKLATVRGAAFGLKIWSFGRRLWMKDLRI